MLNSLCRKFNVNTTDLKAIFDTFDTFWLLGHRWRKTETFTPEKKSFSNYWNRKLIPSVIVNVVCANNSFLVRRGTNLNLFNGSFFRLFWWFFLARFLFYFCFFLIHIIILVIIIYKTDINILLEERSDYNKFIIKFTLVFLYLL